jgi:hypothetical protein
MNSHLEEDARSIDKILNKTRDHALNFLQSLNERPVGVLPTPYEIASLSDREISRRTMRSRQDFSHANSLSRHSSYESRTC